MKVSFFLGCKVYNDFIVDYGEDRKTAYEDTNCSNLGIHRFLKDHEKPFRLWNVFYVALFIKSIVIFNVSIHIFISE